MKPTKLALLALGLLSASAHAQLVFGSTQYTAPTAGVSGAFYLDVTTGAATQLWIGASNKKVSALAVDSATGSFWGADNARLLQWNWGTVGTVPTEVSGLYRLGSNGTTYPTFVGSMAFANQKVYAYTNYNLLGSGPFVEDGIYTIDPTVPRPGVNMTLVWRHDDLAYNFEGMDYSPETGLFYANNNVSDPLRVAERGIYTIDVSSGTVTKIANYSAFLPSPDGLAIGGGKLWLTQKDTTWTSLRIEAYDLATGHFAEQFELPGFPTGGRFTGAAWYPRPSTTVRGTLTLGDTLGPRAFATARFVLTPVGGGTATVVDNVPVNPNGTYEFSTSVLRPQRVSVRVRGFLRATVTTNQVFGATPVTNLDATLVNGDIDGDNSVTVFDYDALSNAFDTTSESPDWATPNASGIAPRDADLDHDNAVTVFDYDILSRNFDRTGDSE